jgi:hypothetical protein
MAAARLREARPSAQFPIRQHINAVDRLVGRSRYLEIGDVPRSTTLLKLAGLSYQLGYVDIAFQALAQMRPLMAQYPLGSGQWLRAHFCILVQPERSPLPASTAPATR